MKTALLIVAILAAVDLVIFGVTLAAIGYQYHRLRRQAAVTGDVLPPATGQFIFVGILVAIGVVALIASLFGLLWSL